MFNSKLLLLAPLAAFVALPVQAQDLKIGWVTTLTTPAALIGRQMVNGANLALDHIGHKMGGRTVKILYEDDGLNPKTGKQKPLLRAYSIASPSWDEELEFYSIKVQDGPLTSKLQHIQPGDEIILRPKPVGTLVHDALLPGKRIWFFATGTGFAPFASLLRDPQTYEDYDEVIITHTCREAGELVYGAELIEGIKNDELLRELIGDENLAKLKYYPTTTREESPKMGRITDLMRSGEAFTDLGVEPLNPETDRAMICGNLAFNLELKEMLEDYGLEEGANSDPKHYVVEKAFLD